MKHFGSMLREGLALVAMAAVIAVAANAVRAKNSIEWGRNYFDKGTRTATKPPDDPPTQPAVAAGSEPVLVSQGNSKNGGAVSPPAAKVLAPAAVPSDDDEKHLEHPYQEIKFEQVKAIFEGTDPTTGAYLFVDARNDQLYADGHIPGAVQCDHYRLNDYIDSVLPLAEQVEKVIVYCNGGDCEDSIFMCGDLAEAGIPFERLYLFAGGWKQWITKGMPAVRGGAPGSLDTADKPTAGDKP